MSFDEGFNIKKVVIYLLIIMLAAYGLGTLIIIGKGGNLVSGPRGNNGIGDTKANYAIDDTKTLSLDGINEINVDVSSASINIIPEGKLSVKAHYYGNMSSNSSYTKPELQCSKSGNTLVIKVVRRDQMTFGLFSSNIKLDVYIPSNYNKNIKIVSTSGDINVNDYKLNKLQCNLSSGSLNLSNINAETFNYLSSSGGLNADKLTTKTTTLNSSSGSININMFSGNLKSQSSSGSTKIEYANFNNNIDIHSSSGEVALNLPKSSQFILDATASSGEVTCGFPIAVSGKKNDHKLQGVVISDKNKISLDVSSGDINIMNGGE